MNLPFLSVFFLPLISIWLLKSEYNEGPSRSIKLFSSNFLGSLGGIYTEHLWRVADIPTACIYCNFALRDVVNDYR